MYYSSLNILEFLVIYVFVFIRSSYYFHSMRVVVVYALNMAGHKVLIFSQMVRVLDILEDYVRFKGYGFERLDGNSSGNLRQVHVFRNISYDATQSMLNLSYY